MNQYNEEEERAYVEWEMKQPGYWRDKLIAFVMGMVTLAFGYLAYLGITS